MPAQRYPATAQPIDPGIGAFRPNRSAIVDLVKSGLACAIDQLAHHVLDRKRVRCVRMVRRRSWNFQPATPLSLSIRAFALLKPLTAFAPSVVVNTKSPA